MKKIFIVLSALVILSGAAQAQDKPASLGFTPSSYYTISWNTTFTMGDFNKWVGNASPAGFDLGGRYFIKGGLAAGFNIMWQRVGQTYTNETFYLADGAAITATNYRFTWMVPFQGVIAYHFMPGKMLSPYVGLGIGGDYMEHHMLVQEYDAYKTRWDFSLTPEVGALVKFGAFSSWGALVAFNYKWTTNKIEFTDNITYKNIQMLNLKVGLVLIVR
ncbi:MAG: outer membrane beta-barrel protein [Bacteroidales bacterium]